VSRILSPACVVAGQTINPARNQGDSAYTERVVRRLAVGKSRAGKLLDRRTATS